MPKTLSAPRLSRGVSFATSSRSSPQKSSADTEVHHRSDMLMQEQIEYTNKVQNLLEESINRFETCDDPEMKEKLNNQVFQLRQRSEEIIVMLHLVAKLHTELHYARLELQKALKFNGDVNLFRKRVGWLEDRMEALLVKQRYDSPVHDLTYDAEVEEGYLSDQSNNSVEEETEINSLLLHTLPKKSNKKQKDTETETASGDSEQNEKQKKRQKKQKKALKNEKEYINQQNVKNKHRSKRRPMTIIETSSDLGAETDDERASSDEIDSESFLFTQAEADDELGAQSGDIKSIMGDKKSADKKRSDVLTREALNQSPIVRETSPGIRSKVTVKTPTELMELFGDLDDEIDEIDAGKAYWQQEHHRFEYSNHAQLMCDLNPLSFHQMGVAVPGTFVEKVDSKCELPWHSSKVVDMSDIHRVSLDKLQQRIHKFYNKIDEGAKLSVHVKQDWKTHPALANVMNSFDFAFTPMSRGSSVPPITSKLLSPQRPRTQDTTQLPELNNKRLGTSVSGRLIYYPKPLPYPDKLPLCKTDYSQDFPKLPEAYTTSKPGKNAPAERIVNQRSLYNETKFTSSLFHTKLNRKKDQLAQAQMEQKLKAETPETSMTSQPMRKVTLKTTLKAARAAVSFKGSAVIPEGAKKKWNEMKPYSGALDHSGLKWERVKGIVHTNLTSNRVDERVDAARVLGQLYCGDAMVLYALNERVNKDEDLRVKYEAAKSLILLGCWDENVLSLLVQFFQQGNEKIRADILRTINKGKNVQYVDKTLKCFPILTSILSSLCCTDSEEMVDDESAMAAALCLSRLCVSDDNARERLKIILRRTKDSYIKNEVLDALVKQLNCTEWEIVEFCLKQLETSNVWKHRCHAAKLLIILGKRNVCLENQLDKVYEILEKRLWDDPMKQVKLDVARVLAALELFPRACERAEKRLSDPFEHNRIQAVASIGTLGMKSERIMRALLEMLQLDSSEGVRVMVIKTFGILNSHDKRVIRAVREKEKGDGIMAKEARKTLELLGLNVIKSESMLKKNVKTLKNVQLMIK